MKTNMLVKVPLQAYYKILCLFHKAFQPGSRSPHLSQKGLELEEMQLKEAKLKYDLLVVRHELEEIEMEEQLSALQQKSRDLQLWELELQLGGLRKLGPDEIGVEIVKFEQAFLKVHTFTWLIYTMRFCALLSIGIWTSFSLPPACALVPEGTCGAVPPACALVPEGTCGAVPPACALVPEGTCGAVPPACGLVPEGTCGAVPPACALVPEGT